MTASTLPASGFTQETFDSFMASRDEPAWLTDHRADAWKTFCELGMPTGREEEWMRTDIRLFKLDRFTPFVEADPGTDIPSALLARGVDYGGHCVCLNSQVMESDCNEKWTKQGVLFGSLDALVSEHSDLLRPFIERQLVNPAKDKFSALNSAFWSGGNLLYVPKGVCIDQPLHALSALTDGGVDLGKTLVILEEGAEATLKRPAPHRMQVVCIVVPLS